MTEECRHTIIIVLAILFSRSIRFLISLNVSYKKVNILIIFAIYLIVFNFNTSGI